MKPQQKPELKLPLALSSLAKVATYASRDSDWKRPGLMLDAGDLAHDTGFAAVYFECYGRRTSLTLQMGDQSGGGLWQVTRDGDKRALALYERHYSCRQYRDGRMRRLFCGPGEKMVLLTRQADALFVWRKFIDRSGQQGVNCAVFRNEGKYCSKRRSSRLIRAAMELAWRRWPGSRLYTYVNPRKIRSTNPGYCFQAAGWTKCGISKKNRLIILEALPTSEESLMG